MRQVHYNRRTGTVAEVVRPGAHDPRIGLGSSKVVRTSQMEAAVLNQEVHVGVASRPILVDNRIDVVIDKVRIVTGDGSFYHRVLDVHIRATAVDRRQDVNVVEEQVVSNLQAGSTDCATAQLNGNRLRRC